MFYGDNVQNTRQAFFSSWNKHKQGQPLSALDQQLITVILEHPEYQSVMNQQYAIDQAYYPELGQSNPFLHMGLHLALREQTSTDRPSGILSVYQQLLKKHGDRLTVEHKMMECLVECLWQAQRGQKPPDEILYLEALSNLLQ